MRISWTTPFIFVLALGFVAAEDPPTAEIKPGDVAPDPALQELVTQLDAKKKDDRDAAFARLKEAGAAAIPALEEGAIQGKRETTNRTIDILQSHLKSPDPAIQKGAIDALQRLAASKNPVAVKRARDILQGANLGVGRDLGGREVPNGGFAPQPGLGGIGGGFGQFGGPPGAGTGEGQDFSIQFFDNNVNPPKRYKMKGKGKSREIEAEENHRKVKIKIDEQGGIQMEITEQKDGKETTRSIDAKDAADLKEKDAEAAKDFEKYSKPPSGFHFGLVPGGRFGAGGVPFGPGVPGIPGVAGDPAAGREALEKQIKLLEEAIENIRKNPEFPRPTKQTQIEVLQQQIRLIRAQMKELDRAGVKKP